MRSWSRRPPYVRGGVEASVARVRRRRHWVRGRRLRQDFEWSIFYLSLVFDGLRDGDEMRC